MIPENFDNLVSSLLEEAAKCTGPTKKASSDRKGKKWTKCARQSDGSYKRIHWGQAGVRVTGKSGNTKRRQTLNYHINPLGGNVGIGVPNATAQLHTIKSVRFQDLPYDERPAENPDHF
jgi:hypothetical protein